MQENKIPKIFISYSWSSEELVLKLAQRLVFHGIDVVLNKWDLKEGQDKYAFMERCVNDPEIIKVFVICDKTYARKANNRTGGVGDETVIISSDIYGNMRQDKFIPVIVEKYEDGKPCVPTYMKTRIYIDLSDPAIYEVEYEKLLRNIYDKPLYEKPKLGKKPEWLDEKKTDFFLLKDLIHQIRGSNISNKRKNCIAKFQIAYIEDMKIYFEKGAKPERIYEIFLNTKPIRDIFLDFVETIAETEIDYAGILAECFEILYNKLTYIKTFEISDTLYSDNDFDLFKIHIWELFICVIAFMLHIKDYKAINTMLTHIYFLDTSLSGGNVEQSNYKAFWYHSCIIEDKYKPKTDKKNKFTLIGDVLCNQREKNPIYTGEAIAEADLFLYQVSNAYDLVESEQGHRRIYWFPTCYIYAKNMPIEWGKMKSRRFCEKMMLLFGVDNISDLKKVVGKCTCNEHMRYSAYWNPAKAILSCIKIEDIGTLN